MKRKFRLLLILVLSGYLLYLYLDDIQYSYLKNIKYKSLKSKIKITNENLSLEDILRLEQLNNQPSFIYITSGYSIKDLEVNSYEIQKLYTEFGNKINVIYLVYGRFNSNDFEKSRWFKLIAESELYGYHIISKNITKSLEPYQKIEYEHPITTYYLPRYFITNGNGIIVDTVYDAKIDHNQVLQIIKNAT